MIRVVYEATGAYHKGLERALGAHLPLVKVNPLQARRFAQAQGVRAKTDAVGAKILAIMGETFGLGARQSNITNTLRSQRVTCISKCVDHRSNPHLEPSKVALTALIRKLIELANALIKANRLWVTKWA